MRLIKNYFLPILLSFLLYVIIYFTSNKNCEFGNIGIIYFVILGLLIRTIDDLVDYNQDLLMNKLVLNKTILYILFTVLSVILFIIVLITNEMLYLLIYLFMYLSFIDKNKCLVYLKSLYIPGSMFSLIYYQFEFNIYNGILLALFLIIDLYLIYKSQRGTYVFNKKIR